MYWSGMPREDDIHQYGVGILVNNRFRKAILDYKFVNESIMMMRFKGTGRNLTIVQCYAPTEDATSDAKDAFYDSLTNAIGTIMKNDMKVLMGDFNAKVGAENTDLQHIMGVHGIGTMNNNGERLVELCGVNEFKIGGTLFPHKHCHKVTWRSPDNKTENQIDHICVSAKWSICLCDVRNRRGADIGSDHHLLVGNLRFIVGRVKRNRNSKCHRVKYNTDKLKSSHQRNIFVQLLETKLMEPSPMNTIEQNWTSIKSAVLEACIEGLGRSRNTKEEFITQRTWKIIDERAKLKNKINATRSISERKLIQREYTLKDKQVKRAIRDDKREHMTNFVREAENAAAAHNMKDLFKITKKIAGSRARRSVPVKNLQGQLLTNIDDQLKRWKQHFMSVLNVQREGIVITNNPTSLLPISTEAPSKLEIVGAIKALKNGKAAGVDNIAAEALKVNPGLFSTILHPFFEQIWNAECFPNDWLQGIIVKLPKKGDATDCNNWRGITILCVFMKVFMKIIMERMITHVDNRLRPEQAGFRGNKSCIDHINTLRIIIEQAVEMRSPLYLLFVDYEKAFDSIHRECIWAELRNVGVPEKIISIIRSSYDGFKCSVQHEGQISEPFETISGVRQGCLLSPLLFLIVIDAVSKRANENKSRGIMWNPTRPIDRLESLDYADDKCELSHRLCDMQDKLNDLAYTSSTVGLRINIAKTKEIRINSRSDDPLILHQKHVQRVEDFQYLGSVVTEDGGTIKDVESRIRKAIGAFTQLNRVWSCNIYSVKTKIQIFKSCVLAVLLYGCETWFVTEGIKNKLRVFVNRCLRRILKIFWPRIISNEQLWARAEVNDINIEIRRRKFGWIGHTLRKPPAEICYHALNYNPQGSRKRGRPRNTWRRSTLQEVNEMSVSLGRTFNNIGDLKDLTTNRKTWRQLIDSLCPV